MTRCGWPVFGTTPCIRLVSMQRSNHSSRCPRHSLNAISCQLSPVPGCSGIDLLEAETFDLHCFQSLTGVKFLLIVEPHTPFVPTFLQRCGPAWHVDTHSAPGAAVLNGCARRIYEMYTDYVLKNPFYEVEQVIKCELFDEQVDATVRRYPVLS